MNDMGELFKAAIEEKKKKVSILINGKIAATWDGNKKKCFGCKAEIGFAVTRHGNRMPFDFDEDHTSHFATCPNANQHRK